MTPKIDIFGLKILHVHRSTKLVFSTLRRLPVVYIWLTFAATRESREVGAATCFESKLAHNF